MNNLQHIWQMVLVESAENQEYVLQHLDLVQLTFLTGIATAQADSAPMVAVTGQVPVKMIGNAFQESDIIGMANPVVKYAFQPRDAKEIPEIVKKGFYIAETGRPGPVLFDIPKDVQQNEAEMEFPEEFKIRGYHPWTDPDIQN